MHVTWYTAMSMDGRIASADHDLDFLDTIRDRSSLDDFPRFIATIDAVLVGASTLRWLMAGGHGWPHDDLATWLVSHDRSIVERIGPTRVPVHRVEGDISAAFDQMEEAGHERVWLCGGGDVAAQALRLDRIDEVVVTIAPVALGAGPALFDGLDLPQHAFEVRQAECVAGNAVRVVWERDRSKLG